MVSMQANMSVAPVTTTPRIVAFMQAAPAPFTSDEEARGVMSPALPGPRFSGCERQGRVRAGPVG
jgi:hypothetical protein